MDEARFIALAEAELAHLETGIDALDLDLDVEPKPGGILEIGFDNGSKIVINRHVAAREIWVAARSGGYHFAFRDGRWLAGRDGAELYDTLSRALGEQSGQPVTLAAPATR